MNKKRCDWSNGIEIYEKYHDEEWGREVHDDKKLFEMLVLEGMQAGLSWLTVLKKRENYRHAFDNFDYKKIANYSDNKVSLLLENEGIIRNKLKINSIIRNAKAFIKIQDEFGSFDKYIRDFADNKKIVNHYKNIKNFPSNNELSDKISKDLKKRGFNFVGTTIIYAYMQAIGMVDDHMDYCFLKKI